MRPFPLPPLRQAAVLRAVATLGLLAALMIAAAGWIILGAAQRAVVDSLQLTGETLAALDASAGVANETVEALAISLAALEGTSADLQVAFDDGEVLMGELAGLVRTDVAGTLEAVEGALPGVIDVANTIDVTLGALSVLPFGPSYDPEESFAASLLEVSTAIEGVPDRLREQADVIDDTAGSLASVGDGVGDLAAQLATFETTLDSTTELLSTYDETITEGSAIVAEAQEGMAARLWFGRIAVVVFALSFASLQIIPLHLAALADEALDRRATRRRLGRRRSVRPPAPPSPPAVPPAAEPGA